jgi:hypothetical protein
MPAMMYNRKNNDNGFCYVLPVLRKLTHNLVNTMLTRWSQETVNANKGLFIITVR